MRLRNKSYSYPIIVEYGGYYVDSYFKSNVEYKMEGYNISLKLTAELINEQLERMLDEDIVEIAFHIECPQTSYRKYVSTKYTEKEFLLKNSEVNGEVNICSFLIAKKDIPKYTNDLFANDYRGFKFDIEKGCILAIGNQVNLTVEKIKDDMVDTTSIFKIIPNLNETETNVLISLGDKKIEIKIPEETYYLYLNNQNYFEIQPLMHSMFIVPALMYTFIKLKECKNELYYYEDARWFQGLKKSCERMDIKIDSEGLSELDAFVVAQKLLDSPIVKAVNFMNTWGGNGYED